MSQIYEQQLTSRAGGSTGNLTARGANHFLNNNTINRSSNKFPTLLKSSRKSNNTGRSTKRSTSRRPTARSTARSMSQSSSLACFQSLPHLQSNLLITKRKTSREEKQTRKEAHNISRQLNKKISNSMKKLNRGVGLKLLAPTKSTKQEKEKERTQLELLRTKLLEDLQTVDEELIAEKILMDKKKSMLEQYKELSKKLNVMEIEQERIEKQQQQQQHREDDQEDNQKDDREDNRVEEEAALNYSGVTTSDGDSNSSTNNITDANPLTMNTKIKFNHQLSSTFENVQQCLLGDSYAPDVLQRNSDSYNGQQSIGSGPHDLFTAPSSQRATVVAGRYYPAGQNPLLEEDGGIFWPFEEVRKRKNSPENKKDKSRRVAPRAARVSAKVQGGYGALLIDVDDSMIKEHQQPSRWSALDPSTDVISMERAGIIINTPRGTMKKDWCPQIGAKCNARYSSDREWYLATILDVQTNGLKVKFESRGNNKVRTVLPSNVKPVVWNRPLTAQWSRNK